MQANDDQRTLWTCEKFLKLFWCRWHTGRIKKYDRPRTIKREIWLLLLIGCVIIINRLFSFISRQSKSSRRLLKLIYLVSYWNKIDVSTSKKWTLDCFLTKKLIFYLNCLLNVRINSNMLRRTIPESSLHVFVQKGLATVHTCESV